jgi:hypothetical protein
MRIIIELTEEESRSTKLIRESAGGRPAERSQPTEIPTSDGGSPSNELLSSLGGGTTIGGSGVAGDAGGGATNGGGITNAGEPSGWLALALGKIEE